MNILSPSILSADFNKLGEQIQEVREGGAAYLHFDVMDGMFVPNISFGIPVLASVRRSTDLFLDVHLMITEPSRYVEQFAKAGADLINVHLEACSDVEETLATIREKGKKTGLTISPDTPVEALDPYLSQVDMILLMSVYPGFGGQSFIEASLDRIRWAKSRIGERGLSVDIEVDGGITCKNVHRVLEAGANVIVAGSEVFRGDVLHNTRQLMEILNG